MYNCKTMLAYSILANAPRYLGRITTMVDFQIHPKLVFGSSNGNSNPVLFQ